MPIPTSTDPENAGQTDQQKFDEVLVQARDSFPQAAVLIPQYRQLVTSMRQRGRELEIQQEPSLRDSIFKNLQKEYRYLTSNDDLRLMRDVAYVIPAPFSVCLFIRPSTYDSYSGRYYEGVGGFHEKDTIWNFIRDEGVTPLVNILSYRFGKNTSC